MKAELKNFARALAAANGHPDPDAYADNVAEHFDAPAAPAEPAPSSDAASAA